MLLCLNHALVSKLAHGDGVSIGWVPILIMCSLHGWNGLYYAQRVCGERSIDACMHVCMHACIHTCIHAYMHATHT
jgi:hypothetical protein